MNRQQEIIDAITALHQQGKQFVTRKDIQTHMKGKYLKTSHSGAITALKKAGKITIRPGSKPELFQLPAVAAACPIPGGAPAAAGPAASASRISSAGGKKPATKRPSSKPASKRPSRVSVSSSAPAAAAASTTSAAKPTRVGKTAIAAKKRARKSVAGKKRKRSTGASRRKPSHKSYSTYIYKVLKQVHPNAGITRKAMIILDNIAHDMIGRFGSEVATLLQNRSTLSAREVQSATRLLLPGELQKHAVSETIKALTAYNASEKGGKSHRAGLVLPVARIGNHLRALRPKGRQSAQAAVALTAVIEYLMAEITELAGNAAKDNKKMRITPRHLSLAVHNDEELNKALGDAVFSQGGSHGFIHELLLPAKKAKTSQ